MSRLAADEMTDAPVTPTRLRERGGATERVTSALREAIVTLEFTPGQALDKAALAERFGVSRFPIAEAFNRLKAEGLVEIRPQSGTFVSRLRLSDARENMFLRRALEGEAAALLATRKDPSLLAAVENSLVRQRAAVEAGDQPGFHRLDLGFHDLLAAASGYPRMRALVEQARLALDRARRALITPRRHQLSLAEHEAVFDAIRAADPDGARAAMAHHIDSVMRKLELFAQAHPGVFADGT